MGARARTVCAAAIAAAAAFVWSHAGATEDREYQIKAAFLYNFVKFVEWPSDAFAGADSALVVGVLGEDHFGDALNALEGKTAYGRRIEVRRYERPGDAVSAHLLFISASESERLAQVLDVVAGGHALTVGDFDGFTEAGGVIRFYQRKNKMRIQINTTAADRASLKISSKLLNIADIVGT